MGILDQVNLNHLRVFGAVYKTGSMTKAANTLHLTQSGVSQHIKNLEQILDVALFDRIKQKLVPTIAGKQLYLESSETLDQIGRALQRIVSKSGDLEGDVCVGMPADFGFNVVIPLLGLFVGLYPKINIKVKLDLAHVMNEKILSGEVDIAFVDGYEVHKQIDHEYVYDQPLLLCYNEKIVGDINNKDIKFDRSFFESLDYVLYEDDAPILKQYFLHHYQFKKMNFKKRAVVADVIGVEKFIELGGCFGVLPKHNKLFSDENIKIFKAPGEELCNKISLAYLSGRTQNAAVDLLKKWLQNEIKNY